MLSQKKIILISSFLAIVVVGISYYLRPMKEVLDKGGKTSAAVPVLLTNVVTQDFPIYLDGIGTVQPFRSVLIRARIDGMLDKVVFKEGDNINEGDLLAVIDPRAYQAQLDQALAKKDQDQASLNDATLALSRSSDLIQRNVLAKQDFDKARFLVDQLKALVAADQAAVENAQVQLGYTQITSPITGRAGVRLVDQGNLIHANDATGIVLINQMQPISVLFTLPEKNLLSVQEQFGSNPLKVLALDHNNTKQLAEGTLSVVDNQIDQTTGTVKLKAMFSNQDLSLWPGQFINCRLLLKTLKDAIVVPTAVVQRGPKGSFVYVVNSQQKAEMRRVEIGEAEGGFTLIKEGLCAGESVVIDGQYKLRPGSTVVGQ
ncbi:MAG: efflux RND transporter periplasmic adaptor subunit [Chthoniobacterales bacterium]